MKSKDNYLKREQREDGSIRESHPAYGVINLSRVSGDVSLFNSNVRHNHFIALEIKEAERVIDGVAEHLWGRKQLIKVYMTEAQFAQMITQPNQGEGVACTIREVEGDPAYPGERFGRPSPPEPEPFTERYHEEVGEYVERINTNLKLAQEYVEELRGGVSKPNKTNLKELADRLDAVGRDLQSNLPYISQQMSEHLEKKLSTAVVEFETYVGHSLQAKGLSHLVQEAPKLVLGESRPAQLSDGTKE